MMKRVLCVILAVGACASPIATGSGGNVSGECRREEFLGSALNARAWTVVRRDNELRVQDGWLRLTTAQADLFGPGGDVPNIVLQDAPTGAFMATAKLLLPS